MDAFPVWAWWAVSALGAACFLGCVLILLSMNDLDAEDEPWLMKHERRDRYRRP